jgi:hypothetical protein
MDSKSPLLFVAAIMVFLSPGITFARISANADVSYSETKSTTAGATTSTWRLNQNYTLSLSKPLTRTISFFGNVSFTITETKDGERSEDIFPLFVLDFSPPSFVSQWYNLRFSFNRTQTAPSEGASITSSNTSVSLIFPFKRWPAPSFTFNRSTTQDDLDPHKVDSVTSSIGFKANYQVDLLGTKTNFIYSFFDTISESKVTEIKNESPTHFVEADFSRGFWEKKIRTNANIGFSIRESKTESLGAPQRFETSSPADQGISGIFTGPAFDATDPSFTNNALIDGNISSSAGINLDVQSTNIVIGYNAAKTLNKINLSITTSLTKAVIDTLNFGWQLFTSDDGISWTFQGVQLPVYEVIPSQRFVFTFTERSARFFRLVNTLAPNTGSPIEVTEMEGVGFILLTPRQSFSSTQTRNLFRISFTPVEALIMSYNISYAHNEDDFSDVDTTSVTQGVSLGYTVIPRYLSLSSGFATSSTRGTGGRRAGTDSYNLTLSSTPLPTLSGSLGFRRAEVSSGGTTTSRRDSLSGSVSMKLYRGVDVFLGGSFSESTNLAADSKIQTTDFSGNFRLKPLESLSILINGGLTRNVLESDGAESTSTIDTLTSAFSLRLTRKLFLSSRIVVSPDSSQSYVISWVASRKLQTTARLGFSGDSTNFGSILSWHPLSRVSLSFTYSGSRNDKTDVNIDSFFARGSVSF